MSNASGVGMSEMMIMRTLANKIAMESVMRMNANNKLSWRLATRNLFPLIKIFDVPVMVVITESFAVEVKVAFMRGSITWCTRESSRVEPMSAIWHEMRILLKVESTNDL